MLRSIQVNRKETEMHTKLLLFSAAATLVVGVALLPQATFAYKGDPAVQGPNYTAERHETMTNAFESNDYAAWKELTTGKGVANRITAENFPRFAEAHRLATEGKVAESQAIRAELGLGMRNSDGGGGRGNGQGMRQGCTGQQ